MVEYIPNDRNKPHTFDHRLAMCEAFVEGSEVGDAVTALTRCVRMLAGSFGFHETQHVLLVTEKICEDYVEYLRSGCDDFEEYDQFPIEVFKHFTGGAGKLSEEEYNKRRRS
jgi:hypothetical protein